LVNDSGRGAYIAVRLTADPGYVWSHAGLASLQGAAFDTFGFVPEGFRTEVGTNVLDFWFTPSGNLGTGVNAMIARAVNITGLRLVATEAAPATGDVSVTVKVGTADRQNIALSGPPVWIINDDTLVIDVTEEFVMAERGTSGVELEVLGDTLPAAFTTGTRYPSAQWSLPLELTQLLANAWDTSPLHRSTLTFNVPEGVQIIGAEWVLSNNPESAPWGTSGNRENPLTIVDQVDPGAGIIVHQGADTVEVALPRGLDNANYFFRIRFRFSVASDFPAGNIPVTVGGTALTDYTGDTEFEVARVRNPIAVAVEGDLAKANRGGHVLDTLVQVTQLPNITITEERAGFLRPGDEIWVTLPGDRGLFGDAELVNVIATTTAGNLRLGAPTREPHPVTQQNVFVFPVIQVSVGAVPGQITLSDMSIRGMFVAGRDYNIGISINRANINDVFVEDAQTVGLNGYFAGPAFKVEVVEFVAEIPPQEDDEGDTTSAPPEDEPPIDTPPPPVAEIPNYLPPLSVMNLPTSHGVVDTPVRTLDGVQHLALRSFASMVDPLGTMPRPVWSSADRTATIYAPHPTTGQTIAAIFTAGSAVALVNGVPTPLGAEVRQVDGIVSLPIAAAAAVFGYDIEIIGFGAATQFLISW
jgi:hypothetical protein